MKKKIFCFVLIFYILFLNCIPCFALESFSLNNFQGSIKNYIVQDRLDYINNNLNFNLLAFILNRDFSTYLIVFKSTDSIDYNFNSDHNTITFLNNTDNDVYVSSYPAFFENSRIPANGSIDWYPAGYGPNFGDGGSLIYKGDCINNDFCSADVYVDPSSSGDYEEDGVIIKGLIGFFSKIEKSINSISDKILKGIEDLIGLPPEGYFGNKFSEIKTNFDNKYNLGSMFDLFSSMKNIQPLRPTFEKTFTLKIGDLLDKTTGKKVFSGLNVSIPFKINFDFIDGIKEYLFLFMRAFGYFYLVIYNMNQYYLLFRGQRFFYDMRESYHYKDSEGKEHNHERGDKKWY